ncbi:MAG: GNAT family N-acetyltransferase [Rickettsiales bacterium]
MKNADAITLRPFIPSDINAVNDVFTQAVRIRTAPHYSDEQRRAWAPDRHDKSARIAKCLRCATRLAVIETRVVGFVSAEANGHIDMLYVRPEHTKKGVGGILLAWAEDYAAGEGAQRFFAEVSITARPFFEKKGFFAVKEQKVELNGVIFINYEMIKRMDR